MGEVEFLCALGTKTSKGLRHRRMYILPVCIDAARLRLDIVVSDLVHDGGSELQVEMCLVLLDPNM